ncbi:Protein of unknown function [Bacillus toyonensis]|nr:Protein of unknown function [Bacillus toyonensis]
MAERNEK